MSIKNQKTNYELYKLYENLKAAEDNLAAWSKKVNEITVQIKLLENYDADASVEEKKYINDLESLSVVINDAKPVKPKA